MKSTGDRPTGHVQYGYEYVPGEKPPGHDKIEIMLSSVGSPSTAHVDLTGSTHRLGWWIGGTRAWRAPSGRRIRDQIHLASTPAGPNASTPRPPRQAGHLKVYASSRGSDDGDRDAMRGNHVRELPSTFTVKARGGKWRIRQITRDDLEEVRRVVVIQADGFHVPNRLPFIDAFLRTSFTAEVLSEMRKKLKYNPVDKFACLVVERADGTGAVEGVVEVSYIDEKEVLGSLEPGTAGVVYIASMAVSPSARRQGAAKALLEGALVVAKEWGEKQAVLHVYQDNLPAVALYVNEGFQTISQDSPLWAKVGVRPRFLMRRTV